MNHTLSKKQFDVLVLLEKERKAFTQRQIEENTGYSLGTINKVMQELSELRYVENARLLMMVRQHLSHTEQRELYL